MFPYCHGMKGFLTKSVAGIYSSNGDFLKMLKYFYSEIPNIN